MNKRISEQHYEDALSKIAAHFSKVEEDVKPVSIYRNGNIGTIGVSDLDLIFVLPDSFDKGEKFSRAYKDAISDIPFREVLFIHNPMLLSENSVRYLPTYTLNPAKELEKIFGKEVEFKNEQPNNIQSVLISIEFIQFRLFQMVNMLQNNNLNQLGILLRGHSMKHSITLANNAGIDLSNVKFSAFDIVEEIRNSINDGKSIQLSNEEVFNLAKGIVGEFYMLYKKFVAESEKYIIFYLPPKDSYSYNDQIEMSQLFDKGKNLLQKVDGMILKIYGMHWINMLIRDLYFGVDDSTAIIANNEFIEACNNRAEFHKQQWKWNMTVFGNIHAGLSPMPSVIGKKAEEYARKKWNIK